MTLMIVTSGIYLIVHFGRAFFSGHHTGLSCLITGFYYLPPP